jgi:hypothetical protein
VYSPIRLAAQDIALSRRKQGFDSPMGHMIPLAFIGRGSFIFGQIFLYLSRDFGIFITIELHPQDQKPIRPRLELEAFYPPCGYGNGECKIIRGTPSGAPNKEVEPCAAASERLAG